jgi:hypothetical protein
MVIITDRNTALPLEQRLSYSVSRVNGRSYTRTWVGHPSSIDAIALVEEPLAEEINVKTDGAVSTLTARYARPQNGKAEVPLETQELDTEAVQQPIFLNDTFASLTQDVVAEIRKQYETKPTVADKTKNTYTAALDAIAKVTKAYEVGTSTAVFDLANKAFDLLQEGTENFENFSWILTRTRTVSRQYKTTKIEIQDINKIFTTEELAAMVNNLLLFDVPSLVLTADDTRRRRFAGWRKKLAKVTDVANGQRQMIETWQLAKWSLDLYSKKTP